MEANVNNKKTLYAKGLFYTYRNGEFVLTNMCKSCAFCCEEERICGLDHCIVLENVPNTEEDERSDI